jgi:hypothetical protein
MYKFEFLTFVPLGSNSIGLLRRVFGGIFLEVSEDGNAFIFKQSKNKHEHFDTSFITTFTLTHTLVKITVFPGP